MFTVAAVSTNVVALPVGTILDRYGPRVSGIIGAIFVTIGAILFAFGAQAPVDLYIPGYLFLALGGPFIFISSFQLSNTFPQYSGLILALLTGAFDTSSAIFLFYRLIYQGTGGHFSPKKFFLCYLVVPAYILVVQIFFMPSTSYKTVGELVNEVEESNEVVHDSDDEIEDPATLRRLQDARRVHRESVVSEITELLGTKDATEQTKEEEKKKNISGVWGALHGRTAAEQIRTPWFILITLFTVLQMTRINYFVATIRALNTLSSLGTTTRLLLSTTSSTQRCRLEVSSRFPSSASSWTELVLPSPYRFSSPWPHSLVSSASFLRRGRHMPMCAFSSSIDLYTIPQSRKHDLRVPCIQANIPPATTAPKSSVSPHLAKSTA